MEGSGRNRPRGEDIVTRKLCTRRESRRAQADRYFSEVLIEVNWVFKVVPSPLTAAMIASAMPAAIRPYSIAVAPASSDKNLLI